MISVSEALNLVCQHAKRLPPAETPLSPDLLGLVLAEEVRSDLDMPPFDKSMMDGYAVRSADLGTGEAPLEIIEEIPAGHVPTREIHPGHTSRIMTGAGLPRGADAVVMVERSTLTDDRHVRLKDNPAPGQNVLKQGTEMRKGDVILPAGSILRPQELGLLAAVGRTKVQAYRPPTVAILSTGNELVEPQHTPGPGQIRNSNATLLTGQVTRARGTPRYLGIALDTLDSLRPLVREGLQADVLLLSGGVSMGQLDLVPQVLQEEGVTPIFHKIAMKPGKPLFFGTKGNTLVFGLPGNPVSSFIGFELFVRPALRRRLGRSHPKPVIVPARLAVEHRYKSDRPTYHPCRWENRADGWWWLTPLPWHGSADLRTVTRAQAFAIFPVGEHAYAVGAKIGALAPELDL
jgi:molybdopterin molybdotransferase